MVFKHKYRYICGFSVHTDNTANEPITQHSILDPYPSDTMKTVMGHLNKSVGSSLYCFLQQLLLLSCKLLEKALWRNSYGAGESIYTQHSHYSGLQLLRQLLISICFAFRSFLYCFFLFYHTPSIIRITCKGLPKVVVLKQKISSISNGFIRD